MCRRSRGLALCALLWLAAPAAGDEVAEWLEQRGLTALLAVHLERQLENLRGDERAEIIDRLGRLYAELLETTDDPELLRNLQERGNRLLAATSSGGEALHLAMLRGRYRGAEQTAEGHRLRQAPEADVQRARETFAEIIPKLNELRGRIDSRHRVAEARLGRSGGAAASSLESRADELGELHSQCTFLAAWAHYYHAWLNGRRDNARIAEQLFAELLVMNASPPRPGQVSVDLRAIEPMARSILGMALCRSLTASSATALEWLDLLDHEQAWAPLREQLPAWRLVVRLEHGEFEAARAVLENVAGDEAPIGWIRLAAVHALEAAGRDRDAEALAQLAVTMLAARGELRAVLDLADRYGTEALGDEGFAFRYVRGVGHYQEAREAHGGDEPVGDPRIEELYRLAGVEFEAALAEPDAQRYPDAAASCRWLAGWCRFFRGDFAGARAAFERAAEHLPRARAEEALWMAVVSLDRAGAGGGEMAALIERMLSRYPNGQYTARLRLKQAVQRGADPAAVESLLAIGPDSEVYAAARRRAAQLLYELFRRASGDARLAWGAEYLAVAVPLLDETREALAAGDAPAEAYLARARRALEVALAEGIGRFAAAGRILDALEELGQRDVLSLHEYRDELDCRRVQERLLAGDVGAAEAEADALWARNPGSKWALFAEQALFNAGLSRRQASPEDGVALDLVVRHGRRLLREHAREPEAPEDRRVLALHAAVAGALMDRWELRRTEADAAAALGLYERLLEAAPTDARFLRATALLSQAVGRPDRALGCWRTLAAGSAVGSDRWFEARYHVIALLAVRDPGRARAVMDQHKRLNPEYGPEPWGPRLSALDEQIPPGEDAP